MVVKAVVVIVAGAEPNLVAVGFIHIISLGPFYYDVYASNSHSMIEKAECREIMSELPR